MSKRKSMVKLGGRTEVLYDRLLVRAFGHADAGHFGDFVSDVSKWGAGSRRLLEHAITRRCAEKRVDADPILDRLPPREEARRKSEPRVPAEQEAQAFTAAALKLPAGKRALVLLPLTIGLRAMELLKLPRAEVQRAVKTGELRVVRKGGAEQTLPAEHAKALFEELLKVPSAAAGKINSVGRPTAWSVVGEILSMKTEHTRYQLLHRLVRDTGAAVGLDAFRPHLLRHAFASRMNRDGAPLPTIQAALGHASPQTTSIYIHPATEDVKKYVRPIKLDP